MLRAWVQSSKASSSLKADELLELLTADIKTEDDVPQSGEVDEKVRLPAGLLCCLPHLGRHRRP